METTDLAQEIGKHEPFDSATQEACLNLLRTAERIASAFDQLLKRYGLSRPQYNVLRILRGNGRGLSCREVADQMITADPDVTRLVDRLVEASYVDRRRSEADRRVVLVGLTADGAKLLKRLDAPVAREHDELLGHMTAEELDQLNRLLVKARNPKVLNPKESAKPAVRRRERPPRNKVAEGLNPLGRPRPRLRKAERCPTPRASDSC